MAGQQYAVNTDQIHTIVTTIGQCLSREAVQGIDCLVCPAAADNSFHENLLGLSYFDNNVIIYICKLYIVHQRVNTVAVHSLYRYLHICVAQL